MPSSSKPAKKVKKKRKKPAAAFGDDVDAEEEKSYVEAVQSIRKIQSLERLFGDNVKDEDGESAD